MVVGMFGLLENFLLYHPYREIEVTPRNYGVMFENVSFSTADGVRLHGWYVAPKDPDGPVLLWAHGNAGNLSHRAENIALIQKELRAGVFIFDYRGFGKSEGRPGEKGLYADGRAAFAWLAERVPHERIFLFGRSLGAAVVVKLAVEGKKARGLILESPFESTLAMGKKMFPFLPVGWIISSKFDSAAMIPKVEMPLLILHGDKDGIVPYAQGTALYEAAGSPHKRFFTIKGAGHNDTYYTGGAPYWAAWRDFLENPESR
ncbi:MAG: alpha/beta hydrolase [Nitrospinae bacterium]|nr:alpha/beta hydrolase [Nitrospinota bacterium]